MKKTAPKIGRKTSPHSKMVYRVVRSLSSHDFQNDIENIISRAQIIGEVPKSLFQAA
jgi:hypothetical protein